MMFRNQYDTDVTTWSPAERLLQVEYAMEAVKQGSAVKQGRFNSFTGSSRSELIKDALIATRETLERKKLNSSVCTIAVVGVGEPFHILDKETVLQLIDALEIVEEEEGPAAEPGGTDEQGEEPAAGGAGIDQGSDQGVGVAPMDI